MAGISGEHVSDAENVEENPGKAEEETNSHSFEAGEQAMMLEDNRANNPTASKDKDGELFQSKRLYVSNLSYYFKPRYLRTLFQGFGPLLDYKIIQDQLGSKGFGFVTFKKASDADAARAKLDATVHGGRRIRVLEATPFYFERSWTPIRLLQDAHPLNAGDRMFTGGQWLDGNMLPVSVPAFGRGLEPTTATSFVLRNGRNIVGAGPQFAGIGSGARFGPMSRVHARTIDRAYGRRLTNNARYYRI